MPDPQAIYRSKLTTNRDLVAMGLRTSARAEFAPPPLKTYIGILSDFEIGKRDRQARYMLRVVYRAQ